MDEIYDHHVIRAAAFVFIWPINMRKRNNGHQVETWTRPVGLGWPYAPKNSV